MPAAQQPTKLKRGFAAMHPDVQRRIASAGGRAAHEQGTAHEFDSDEARAAGRKSHQSRAARKAEQLASNAQAPTET